MSIIRETPRNRFVPPYEKKELENWNEKKSEEIAVVETGITRIKTSAFKNCSMKELWLPNSLQLIDSCAFSDCEKLEKIVFGNGSMYVDKYAFENCVSVNEVKFPANSKMMQKVRTYYSIQTYQIDASLKSFKQILDSFCWSQLNTRQNIAKRIAGLLHSGNSTMTVKLTVGDKSIRIPKCLDIGESWFLAKTISKWLATGSVSMEKELLSCAKGSLGYFGTAMEMYLLDNDKTAKTILKKNYSSVIENLQMIGTDALTGYIRLGLLSKKQLEEMLKNFADVGNVELNACILEQLKKKKEASTSNHLEL